MAAALNITFDTPLWRIFQQLGTHLIYYCMPFIASVPSISMDLQYIYIYIYYMYKCIFNFYYFANIQLHLFQIQML